MFERIWVVAFFAAYVVLMRWMLPVEEKAGNEDVRKLRLWQALLL